MSATADPSRIADHPSYARLLQFDQDYLDRVRALHGRMPFKAANDIARRETWWARAAALENIVRSIIEAGEAE